MTNPADVAARYIAAWNETDPARRRSLIEANWAPDATYVDPMASVAGHDGMDALIEGVQQRFPGLSFRPLGQADGYGDQVRFSWSLGPAVGEPPIKGFDVVTLKDGKIRSVIGFLDQVPVAA